MLYLLVDPQFLYLEVETATKEQVKDFIRRLYTWSKSLEVYDLDFGISDDCRRAIKESIRSAFNTDTLQQILTKYDLDISLLIQQCTLLFEKVMDKSSIDVILEDLETEQMYYQIKDISFFPKEYQDRLPTLNLQESFRAMLGKVAFARKNGIVPLFTLQNIGLLTRLEDSETWIETYEAKKIWIAVAFEWSLEDGIENRELLETQTQFSDEFAVITHPDHLKEIFPDNELKKFKNVQEALQAAVDKYPDILVLPRRAEKTIIEHGGISPQRMYELVTGLVTIWLASYTQKIDGSATKRAMEKYHSYFQIKVAEDEGDPAKQHPQRRKDYEVWYDGELVFCGKHVKIAGENVQVRINFEVKKVGEDQYKIILARVGYHGANATDPH